MCRSILLRSILSVDALIGRRLRPRIRPASAVSRYQLQTSAIDLALRKAGDRRIFSPRDSDELLARVGARLLNSEDAIAAEYYPTAAVGGCSVLQHKRLRARWRDADAKAAQFRIPDKGLPDSRRR